MAGLWMMARWKGEVPSMPPNAERWLRMLPAPADSPITVTALGSPPKRRMLKRTHSMASRWS
jgi:hypothetical protein